MHAPHLAHVNSGFLFPVIVSVSIALKGHTAAHFIHEIHLSVSITTRYILTGLRRDCIAPKGQSMLH